MKLSEFLKSLEKAKEHIRKKDPEILIYHDSGNRYTINTVMEHTERNKRQYIFIHGGDKHNDLTPINRSKTNLAARKMFVKKVKSGGYESKIEVPLLQQLVSYTTISLNDSEESIIEKARKAFKNYQKNTGNEKLENQRRLINAKNEDQERLNAQFNKDLMTVYFPDIKEDSDAYKLVIGVYKLDDKIGLVDFFEKILKEAKND